METGNLLDKEFRVTIIKMIREFGRRMNPWGEKLKVSNKELEIYIYIYICYQEQHPADYNVRRL